MLVWNGTPQRLLVKLGGRKPYVVGQEETRFPARQMYLEPYALSADLPNEDVTTILERYGVAGVVAPRRGESPALVIARSREIRLAFLRSKLTEYRDDQADRQAKNLPIQLPRPWHRAWLEELQKLQTLVGEDPVLTADIGGASRPVHVGAQPVPTLTPQAPIMATPMMAPAPGYAPLPAAPIQATPVDPRTALEAQMAAQMQEWEQANPPQPEWVNEGPDPWQSPPPVETRTGPSTPLGTLAAGSPDLWAQEAARMTAPAVAPVAPPMPGVMAPPLSVVGPGPMAPFRQILDPMAGDLMQFGISPEAAPMVPRAGAMLGIVPGVN